MPSFSLISVMGRSVAACAISISLNMQLEHITAVHPPSLKLRRAGPVDTSVGGAHALFSIRGEAEEYNLPAAPDVPSVDLLPAWTSAVTARSHARRRGVRVPEVF